MVATVYDLPEDEQKLFDYADILDDIVISGKAESMYEASQFYNRQLIIEDITVEVHKESYNNSRYNWYFPSQVHAALNNRHPNENYSLDEVTEAHQNLRKKGVLHGKDFNEGKGMKFIYRTMQFHV